MKRNPIAAIYYPDPVTLNEFCDTVIESIDTFGFNMVGLRETSPRYMEEWFRLFELWIGCMEETPGHADGT